MIKFIEVIGAFLILSIGYILGWLMCVLFSYLIFFILGKIGFDIHFNIWWSGLLVYLIWLFFKPKA